MEFTGFITAAGFLAAILLVWAQLWIRTYDEKFRESLNVKLGLFWTIFAILLALLAFSYALFFQFLTGRGENVSGVALGLFAGSLIMALLGVGQSFTSVFIKLVCHLPLFEPLRVPKWFTWLSIGLASALTAASIVAIYCRWVWWVLLGTVVVAIITVLSTVYLQYRKCSQQKLDY
jgi:hypothetical protein